MLWSEDVLRENVKNISCAPMTVDISERDDIASRDVSCSGRDQTRSNSYSTDSDCESSYDCNYSDNDSLDNSSLCSSLSEYETHGECKSTKLFDEIASTNWANIDKFLKTGKWGTNEIGSSSPHVEARTWVVKSKRGNIIWRRLPIHVAISLNAPIGIIKRIAEAYPEGLRCPDYEGNLPLHLCFMPCLDIIAVVYLLNCYPEAVHLRNRYGYRPWECVDESDQLRGAEVIRMCMKQAEDTESVVGLNDNTNILLLQAQEEMKLMKEEIERLKGCEPTVSSKTSKKKKKKGFFRRRFFQSNNALLVNKGLEGGANNSLLQSNDRNAAPKEEPTNFPQNRHFDSILEPNTNSEHDIGECAESNALMIQGVNRSHSLLDVEKNEADCNDIDSKEEKSSRQKNQRGEKNSLWKMIRFTGLMDRRVLRTERNQHETKDTEERTTIQEMNGQSKNTDSRESREIDSMHQKEISKEQDFPSFVDETTETNMMKLLAKKAKDAIAENRKSKVLQGKFSHGTRKSFFRRKTEKNRGALHESSRALQPNITSVANVPKPINHGRSSCAIVLPATEEVESAKPEWDTLGCATFSWDNSILEASDIKNLKKIAQQIRDNAPNIKEKKIDTLNENEKANEKEQKTEERSMGEKLMDMFTNYDCNIPCEMRSNGNMMTIVDKCSQYTQWKMEDHWIERDSDSDCESCGDSDNKPRALKTVRSSDTESSVAVPKPERKQSNVQSHMYENIFRSGKDARRESNVRKPTKSRSQLFLEIGVELRDTSRNTKDKRRSLTSKVNSISSIPADNVTLPDRMTTDKSISSDLTGNRTAPAQMRYNNYSVRNKLNSRSRMVDQDSLASMNCTIPTSKMSVSSWRVNDHMVSSGSTNNNASSVMTKNKILSSQMSVNTMSSRLTSNRSLSSAVKDDNEMIPNELRKRIAENPINKEKKKSDASICTNNTDSLGSSDCTSANSMSGNSDEILNKKNSLPCTTIEQRDELPNSQISVLDEREMKINDNSVYLVRVTQG